jgi:hypothetical protein
LLAIGRFNDGSSWVALDRREKDMTMNSAGAIAALGIPDRNRKEFRLIRLRQTGRNSTQSDCLRVAAIEFCGVVKRMSPGAWAPPLPRPAEEEPHATLQRRGRESWINDDSAYAKHFKLKDIGAPVVVDTWRTSNSRPEPFEGFIRLKLGLFDAFENEPPDPNERKGIER